MKKLTCIAVLLFSIGIVPAQKQKVKKQKKFEENYNYISTSSIGIQMQKYYSEVKAIIQLHEKDLGEEKLNLMLNFNKSEYSDATKNNVWKTNSSKLDKESANILYATNITSKLDSYKITVLEKLADILKK